MTINNFLEKSKIGITRQTFRAWLDKDKEMEKYMLVKKNLNRKTFRIIDYLGLLNYLKNK